MASAVPVLKFVNMEEKFNVRGMKSVANYYCIKCETTNACKCGNRDNIFQFSTRVRPPKNTDNKARFRQFLRDCPEFTNCITEEQRPLFLDLLRKIKMFKTEINGHEWTYIEG